GLERAAVKLESFTKLISLLTSLKETMDLSELVETVIEQTGMEESYRSENTVESQARIENLREFITGVMEYESEMARMAEQEQPEETDPDEPVEVYEAGLEDYLFRVSLSTDIDNLDQDEGFVTLMTLHSAKGLEFNEVFIPGFEEEMFPSYMSIFEEDRLEEERRLCYVGFTRARKMLYLTHVNSRTIFGRTKYPMVSRFFKEIPKSCMNLPKVAPKTQDRQPSFGGGHQEKKTPVYDFGALLTRGGHPVELNDIGKKKTNSQGMSFESGDRVIHAKYGEGTITAITGQGDNAKIEIIFDKFGMKRFMLSMVQLEKI
ncbi:MAG TPA: ATP-dependent DNA helicase PcrA, partial [Clostridiales bacterium]|nr:ATP-dependent DNA helicase PcrA [Clostridiales bacterium]